MKSALKFKWKPISKWRHESSSDHSRKKIQFAHHSVHWIRSSIQRGLGRKRKPKFPIFPKWVCARDYKLIISRFVLLNRLWFFYGLLQDLYFHYIGVSTLLERAGRVILSLFKIKIEISKKWRKIRNTEKKTLNANYPVLTCMIMYELN